MRFNPAAFTGRWAIAEQGGGDTKERAPGWLAWMFLWPLVPSRAFHMDNKSQQRPVPRAHPGSVTGPPHAPGHGHPPCLSVASSVIEDDTASVGIQQVNTPKAQRAASTQGDCPVEHDPQLSRPCYTAHPERGKRERRGRVTSGTAAVTQGRGRQPTKAASLVTRGTEDRERSRGLGLVHLSEGNLGSATRHLRQNSY